MHFEQGGLYLVCDQCNYTWAAVGTHPMRIIQDVMARNMGFSELDKRHNPMVMFKYEPPKPYVFKASPKVQKLEKVVAALSRVLNATPEEVKAVWDAPPPPTTVKIGPVKRKASKKSS